MDKAIHEQMVSELLAFRKMDKSLGIKKHETTLETLLPEMNVRFKQYLGQFQFAAVEYWIYQTLFDYKKHLSILQADKKKSFSPKLKYELPVASLKDSRLIFALEKINDNGEIFIIKSK